MPKAKPETLKPTTTVAEAMRILFPPRVKEILKHEKAVRKSDIEGVHDMRVATKRLREAARVFRPAFGRTRMDRHLSHMAALNDALGKVREFDVMGLQLEALGERQEGLLDGLQPLIDQLAQRRAEANEKLLPVLDETLPYLEEDFAELTRDRSRKRADVWKMPFVDMCRATILRRIDEAFALEAEARAIENQAELHRMRIALKKARYALELCLPLLDSRAQGAYKPIARLQEIMGEVHDRDVMRDHLEKARGNPLSDEAAHAGVALCAQDRAELHGKMIDLLDEIRDKKRIGKLKKALESCC
ncbi:MAG: CHAD domain-containing protein [Armatimonadetes bacterium]|nr:CHAD domain-containing protein [Armatimonadota bacterium]